MTVSSETACHNHYRRVQALNYLWLVPSVTFRLLGRRDAFPDTSVSGPNLLSTVSSTVERLRLLVPFQGRAGTVSVYRWLLTSSQAKTIHTLSHLFHIDNSLSARVRGMMSMHPKELADLDRFWTGG